MKNDLIHITLALLLCVMLLLLTDPFMLWMPSMLTMSVLLAVVVGLGFWAGFVMKEKARDERELEHKMHSGRLAYLSGLLVLTLALIVQGLDHHIDPWLALTLGVMVVAKLLFRIYLSRYK